MLSSAVCLVIDGLHSGYLGCYGNCWLETPALDRFASQGAVCDFAFADTLELPTLYRGYWQAAHALLPDHFLTAADSLPRQLSQHGIHTALITDEPEVHQHPLAVDVDEVIPLPNPVVLEPAATVEQTAFGRLLATAAQWLETAPRPHCLWLHARGPGACWDSPAVSRDLLREEGDPSAYAGVVPPALLLGDDYDPDELLSLRRAYAAEVLAIDTCLGGFLESLDSAADASSALCLVTAPRGLPLGEHRRVGPGAPWLHAEAIHVPLVIRGPDIGPATRVAAFTQPADIAATLAAAFQLSPPPAGPGRGRDLWPHLRDQSTTPAELAYSLCDREWSLRTPAWLLRHVEPAEGPAQTQLFAKPDDRWEVNDVASRVPDVAEALQALARELCQRAQADSRQNLPPLPESLRHRM